ncbi:hypothetical protein [Bacillus sp. FJAT-49736]|uniref:hypothetical protein n=1 Tax=Bacillus sp. FJAT-49736 TaxID=2833582 RepID=UPI001BC9BFAD|nr:hypothetical protein [Bacillus sp. FJAT-49736]MBS4172986.1 hypothetical protein [Bacillus sp. FJAT-49736]
MNHFRKTVVIRNREWVEIDFCQLQKGDNFKMFEQNGEEVLDEFGNTWMQAKSDPYYDLELECWLVDIE